MFDSHPPFQIDGNFGGCAGIAEMLIQSQPGEIRLLPALPAAWKDGSVKGLRARGGYEVSMSWADGHLREVVVKNVAGSGPCTLKVPSGTRGAEGAKLEAGEIILNLKRGQSITIPFAG